MRIRHALLLSDIHLGWSVCARQHDELLQRLPEAAGDAELIVLNGDVIDHHRGFFSARDRDNCERLREIVIAFRAEGRKVAIVEGNHDVIGSETTKEIAPDRWFFDWEGAYGERVRVLHGHRFSERAFEPGAYERFGRHLLQLENYMYSKVAPARAVYRMGPGFFVGAVGWTEDFLWSRDFPGRAAPHLASADVLVHGHFHFGPGHRVIANKPVWRSGAWVSHGHLGSVDRMLRYKNGRFERIGLGPRGFVATDDGL